MGEYADDAIDRGLNEIEDYMDDVENPDQELGDWKADFSTLGLGVLLKGRIDIPESHFDPDRAQDRHALTTQTGLILGLFHSATKNQKPVRQTPKSRMRSIVKYILKCWEDKTCMNCQAPMVEKTGRYGKFWGCSAFPKCLGKPNFKQTFDPQELEKILEVL